MMVNGSDIVMMPGMMLAWILIGFSALLLVAVLVSWLTSGFRERRGDRDALEGLGRDQIARDELTGTDTVPGLMQAQEEQHLENLHENDDLREETRFKKSA